MPWLEYFILSKWQIEIQDEMTRCVCLQQPKLLPNNRKVKNGNLEIQYAG